MNQLFFLEPITLIENDSNILAQRKNTPTKNNAKPTFIPPQLEMHT
jgi:hypothetical protein